MYKRQEKGHVSHRRDGASYVYEPVVEGHHAARGALQRMVDTFFGGSLEKAVSSLVGQGASKMSSEELDRIGGLIEEARESRLRDSDGRSDG